MSSQLLYQFTSSKDQFMRNEYSSQSMSINSQSSTPLKNNQQRSSHEKEQINKSEHQMMLTPENQYYQRERLSKERNRGNTLNYLLDSNKSKAIQFNPPYSPFVSPFTTQNKKTNIPKSRVYFGYQEYEYIKKCGEKDFTTIYYFKVIDNKNPNNDYYHEIVTQIYLKKFYFSVVLKKLIGLLRECNSYKKKEYEIFCNSVYFDSLNQVINSQYQPQTRQQQRSYDNLLQTKKKYKDSHLNFSLKKTDQSELSSMYLDQKEFPCESYSSIRIPNYYSCHESEDFLSYDCFNNYLGKELKDLCNNHNNKQIKSENFEFNGCISEDEEQQILPYYNSPDRNESSQSRSCSRCHSRSPLRCVRYDQNSKS
ncbi:hypothetical protein ABPG72_020930 [Tetrahymena utriculariae]